MGVLSDLAEATDAMAEIVAGVVSGAGGLHPGMVLGKGQSPHKNVSIALVGKVYCKVDRR